MHESVLWARVCPPVLGNSFRTLDERWVVVEDWHAEPWLDDAETIALHRRVWDTFAEAAVFGADARQVIARVRRSIKV
ncbi:Scr1 family TA system antitoxin-like transcriptional regulator [Streptomyces massasporeus]|uniref:Scr1 family TA system antitoxin-like transcriptional regulator n=1 Tax=Streptomyces massasporeus TaxID=67324 RepID=UPI00381274D6